MFRSLSKSILHTYFGKLLTEFYLRRSALDRSQVFMVAKVMNLAIRNPCSGLKKFEIDSYCLLGKLTTCFYSILTEDLTSLNAEKKLNLVFREARKQAASSTQRVLLLLQKRLLTPNPKQIYKFKVNKYTKAVTAAAARLNYSWGGIATFELRHYPLGKAFRTFLQNLAEEDA